MPPKNKAKNAPNQHDKRHESGLAPPGKRVTKKQSNGHLNAQPNGKPVSAGQTPAPPIVNVYQEGSSHADLRDHAGPVEGVERDRTYSDTSIEGAGQCGEMGDGHADHVSGLNGAEVSASASRNTVSGQTGNGCSTISTILAYYPLRDAISILIVLLSVPPTLVLVIQTLFASLTFVPPSTSISLSTLPNIKEMFNSANMGYPALATILIVDLIFWVVWLPLWKPMQVILLDLSQAVIAVSLSGAAASTGGPTYSIATCTTIVCVVHVLRYKAIHLTALDYLRSVLRQVDIGIPLDVPSSATNFVSSPSVDRGWLYTVFRTILGIHIVSQGVTTCIRRSLIKNNEQGTNVPTITKTDPEANAGNEANTRLSSGLVESSQQLSVPASSTDGRPPGPSPAHRDSKARESSTKKKRKQANQVRSQQPLWAAIASTKVTFVKEMEQRDAVDDAREAARMDTPASNTFTSNTNSATDRVWIREVRDTEILFGVELSSHAAREKGFDGEQSTNQNAGIDTTKPFYVRINGANWSSTRLVTVDNEFDEENRKKNRYDGEIFGLAPLSPYQVEIVCIGDRNALCSASIITQPAPSPEQAASSQPPHQALRPASPITTLKQSIQAAESKLNETRNRTKKTKKDQKAGQGDIRREIGTLKTKLESSGGSDDKQKQRLAQINQHRAQAEEAAAEFKDQTDAMGETPADDLSQSHAAKSKWKTADKAKSDATKDMDGIKSEAEREISSLKSEISQTESRREKLAGRLTQRADDLEKAATKAQADMTAKQKRDFERSQLKQKREKEQSDAHVAIAALDVEAQSYQQKTHDTYQQIGALQSWSSQPPPYYSSPPTPDTAHPVAAMSIGSPQSNGFPAFGPQPPYNSPFQSTQPSIVNPQGGPRGRSSSMLSQYSGFTEDGEQYSFAPEMPRAQFSWPLHHGSAVGLLMDDRKESEGSGSASLNNGSTGSNSPRPDAKVFIPGKTPGAIGPIGPPSKSKEKSSQSPVTSPGTIGSGR